MLGKLPSYCPLALAIHHSVIGERLTKERVQQLPEHKVKMHLYGRIRTVHYKSCLCCPGILRGQETIAVWAQFEHKGKRCKTRLLLSTDSCHHFAALRAEVADRSRIQSDQNPARQGYQCSKEYQNRCTRWHKYWWS